MALHPWPKFFTNTEDEWEEMREFVRENVDRFELLVIEIPDYALAYMPDWYIPTLRAMGAQMGFFSIGRCKEEYIAEF